MSEFAEYLQAAGWTSTSDPDAVLAWGNETEDPPGTPITIHRDIPWYELIEWGADETNAIYKIENAIKIEQAKRYGVVDSVTEVDTPVAGQNTTTYRHGEGVGDLPNSEYGAALSMSFVFGTGRDCELSRDELRSILNKLDNNVISVADKQALLARSIQQVTRFVRDGWGDPSKAEVELALSEIP